MGVFVYIFDASDNSQEERKQSTCKQHQLINSTPRRGPTKTMASFIKK